MIKLPIISVIIPVYNVEKYFDKCLDSILRQTYKNLELILIDDGSTDNSGKICDEYAQKDGRIKVIHKKNGGVCSARNKGLDTAKGEYIAFVDPDDYIHPDMYNTLIGIIQKENADIVVCNNVDVDIDGTVRKAKFPADKNFVYFKYTDWLKDFSVYGNLQVLWNKLFKREILQGYLFDEKLLRAEDLNFLLDITKNHYHIVLCPQVFYFYVKHPNSAVRQYKIKYFESEYIVWKRLYETVKNLFSCKDKSNNISKNIYQKFTETAYKLSLLIILLDKDNQYYALLEELIQFFKTELPKRNLLSKRIVRVWVYVFGKYPDWIITILRLPLIKQLSFYYITHR